MISFELSSGFVRFSRSSVRFIGISLELVSDFVRFSRNSVKFLQKGFGLTSGSLDFFPSGGRRWLRAMGKIHLGPWLTKPKEARLRSERGLRGQVRFEV